MIMQERQDDHDAADHQHGEKKGGRLLAPPAPVVPREEKKKRRTILLPRRAILAACGLLVCVSLSTEMLFLGGDDYKTRFLHHDYSEQEEANQADLSENIILPISNVVLMGQFNYGDIPFDSVRDWFNIWSRYFAQIIVAGPFPIETQEKLEEAGIEFQVGWNDSGFVSPTKNLLDTMLRYKKLTSSPLLSHGGNSGQQQQVVPQAVLYVHDDALLNITRLYNGRKSLPTDSIIRSHKHRSEPPQFYSIYVERRRQRWQNGTGFSEVVLPISRFEHTPLDAASGKNRTIHRTIESLIQVLPNWAHWKRCLRPQIAMLSKYDDWWEDFADYSNITTTTIKTPSRNTLLSRITYRFSFPMIRRSDFLYVPLQYSDIFERAAKPHIQRKVFLECAVPTIVRWVTEKTHKMSSKAAAQKRALDDSSRGAPNTQDKPMTTANSFAARVPPPCSVEDLPLCTMYKALDGNDAAPKLKECIRKKPGVWGMYHPLKIGLVTPERYSKWLDSIQGTPRLDIFSSLPALDQSRKNISFSTLAAAFRNGTNQGDLNGTTVRQ